MCRYGNEAAAATRKGAGVAVDAYDVYGSYKQIRTRAIAKAFVKGAFKPGDRPTPQQAAMPMEEGVQIVQPLDASPSLPSPPQGYKVPGYSAAAPHASMSAAQPQPRI